MFIDQRTCALSYSDVHDEIVARAQGKNGWYDPHNRGSYTLTDQSNTCVFGTRVRGPHCAVMIDKLST